MWFWNNYPTHRGMLCYNLANSKNEIDGALNKAMGLVAGRSDLTLYANSTAYFIEMKKPEGVQSELQKKFQAVAEQHGYTYVICRSLDDFKNFIHYLKLV